MSVEELEKRLENSKGEERIGQLLQLYQVVSRSDYNRGMEIARELYELRHSTDSLPLKFDCALTLMNHLGYMNRFQERDELFAEWREQLAESGTVDQRARFNNLMAIAYCQRDEYEEALALLNRSLAEEPHSASPDLFTMLRINASNCYRDLGLFDRASQLLYQALDETERSNNLKLQVAIRNNLCVLHNKLSEPRRAIEHAEAALSIATRIGHQSEQLHALNSLGATLYFLEDYNASLEYFTRLEEAATDSPFNNMKLCALTNIGRIHLIKGRYPEAMERFQLSLQLAAQLGNRHEIGNIHMNIGEVLLRQGDMEQALPNLEKALQIAEEIPAFDLQTHVHSVLESYFVTTQNWRRAYEHHKTRAGLMEKIWAQKQAGIIEEMKFKFEFNHKERETELYLKRAKELEAEVELRRKAEAERERVIAELQSAMKRIKVLAGLLPICGHCKKIRDEEGKWHAIEAFISKHSEALFSHGICPDCLARYYEDIDISGH